MAGYGHPEFLVDTKWLAARLEDPRVRLIEANYDMEAYKTGHIPGAVGWAWAADFRHPVRNTIPDEQGMEALLSRSGIGNETTIVVYGTRNAYATFALWLLKIYGHRDVRALDGGREKWVAEGRPMTTEVPAVRSTTYAVGNPDWSVRAGRDFVKESIGRADRAVVDVRSPEEHKGGLMDDWKYAGGAQRGGHIPGAVNIPWTLAKNSDGTFKAAEELRALFEQQGVTPDKEVVTYCVIGGRSNQVWFVLKLLLGYPRVRLYDGSWAEWGALIDVPIEV